MKIAVNTRLLLPNSMEGIGWYTFETLSRITRQYPEHEFLFLFDRPYDRRFLFSKNVRPIVIGPPARHPFLYIWWFNLSVKKMLKEEQPDIFLSPDGFLCLGADVPQLPVIHDLNFEHYPEDLPFWYRWYYRKYFPRFAKKARRILTVSEYSKQDIVKTYGVDADKIDVAWNGVNEVFKPISAEEQEDIKAEYADGKPYFLYVGAIHPRKNVGRLLQAFDQLDGPEQLLIAGEPFWWSGEMKRTYEGMSRKKEVIFTGRMEQHTLAQVVASATALCYVSYFEGFGIPVVEAMRCGTPVLAAKATSLPEVGGDAALYCDPFDVASIADGMKQICDEERRSSLSAKGMERANKFDWQNTADGMWASIQKCINA